MDNKAKFYDDIYLANPGKWTNAIRDIFAMNSLERYVSNPARMLDYGCGNGHTLDLFSAYWKDTHFSGVDISKIGLKLAAAHVPKGEFFTELPDEKWNVITIMGVAEHFEDIEEELRRIGEHLVPGGYMYVEVPNCLEMSDNPEEGFRRTDNAIGQTEWHLRRETWEAKIDNIGLTVVERITGPNKLVEFIWILRKDSE